MFHTLLDCVPFQEVGKKRGVEMVRVWILYFQICQNILALAVVLLEEIRDLIIKDSAIEIPRGALLIAQRRNDEAGIIVGIQILFILQPPLRDIKPIDDFISLKGMVEVLLLRIPVNEFYRQFVTRIALGHPITFMQSQEIKEQLYGAECCLANAD